MTNVQIWNVWQQILALDARFNAYRMNDANLKMQYIRRRSQLLRENDKNQIDPANRKQYLKLRFKFLARKYGPVSDSSSLMSYGMKGSVCTLDKIEGLNETTEENKYSDPNVLGRVVPTHKANASRALVGGKSVGENYAFAGMYHVIDEDLGSSATAIKFANDDKNKLAFSSMDGSVSICQLQPKPHVAVRLRGHSSGVTDFAWSLSNDLIVSASMDTTLRLWDCSSGNCIRVVAEIRTAPIHCCAFQPVNNNFVVAGDGASRVNVYNISTGKKMKGGTAKLAGAVISLSFDSAGKILWTGDQMGTLNSFTFDLATGRLRKGHKLTICSGHPVTSIQSKSWISREARDPSVLVSIAASILCLLRVTSNKGLLQIRKTFYIKHEKMRVRSVFCPLMSFRQGVCVVTGSEDMSVCFFNVEKATKSCVNRLLGHCAPVLDVSFNYDESLLASCDAAGMVIIWKREL